MSFFWSLGSFLIVIAILIAVHEYGHFWAARRCGVKVERFSIGFGKVLWRWRDKKETEFALSMIPLGGYVKMLDGRNEEVPPELMGQAFDHKPIWQRAFVIAAGPLANFLFAIVAYWAVYSIGMPSVKPVIANVTANSIAAQAGVPANSQILAIDNDNAPDWETIQMLLAAKLGDKEVTISYMPFPSGEVQQRTLNLTDWSFNPEKETAFETLGMEPKRPKVTMTLSKVADDSPAAAAGLHAGDTIIQLNDKPVNWLEFVAQVQEGNALDLKVRRNEQIFSTVLTPVKNAQNKWFAGVNPTVINLGEEYRTEIKYDILGALQKGVEKTAQLSWLTIKVIGKLFTGDLSLNNLSGPISIAQGAGATSNLGFLYFLSFMALISVNLGIMNLFPLPVLDGGHLVFLAAEGIKGKPVSDKVQNFAYRIGMLLLLVLMVFALFNDFLRL